MSHSKPATPIPETDFNGSLPSDQRNVFTKIADAPDPGSASARPHHPPPDVADPLPDDATVLQLLVLSLKTPDYGVVNFRSLYVLLEHMINRMNIAHDRVDLTERPSRDVIREAVRGMPDSVGTDKKAKSDVVDFRDKQRISVLEQKVSTLRLQMEAFQDFPSNERMVEIVEGSEVTSAAAGQPVHPMSNAVNETNGKSTEPEKSKAKNKACPLVEVWQVSQLSKRLDAAEQGLEKALSIMNQLLEDVNKIKNLKKALMRYIQKWMFNPDAAFQQALNGETFGEEDDDDELIVPNKFPFVTWPALREVLIDRQSVDEEGSQRRSVFNAFKATQAAPELIVPQGEDEQRRLNRESQPKTDTTTPDVTPPKLSPGGLTPSGSPHGSSASSSARSSPSPDSTSRSIKNWSATDVPSFIAQPDNQVLDSLAEMVKLLKWSKRVEARLARLDVYMTNVANKNEVKKISEGLEEVRKSLAPVSEWISEWGPSHIGAEPLPNQLDSLNDTSQKHPTSDQLQESSTIKLAVDRSPLTPARKTVSDTSEGSALADQIRELWMAFEQQRQGFQDLQARLSTQTADLTAMADQMKDQAIKLGAGPSRVMLQPKLHQMKAQGTACTVGPSRSEFEIFCRACAENFQMIEIRLAELESMFISQLRRLQELDEFLDRLDRIKADSDQVGDMVSTKADSMELKHKVDKQQFYEVAQDLRQKVMDVNDDLRQQGDGLCASLKCLEDRLESDLSTDPLASLVEQANRNLHLVNNRVVQLEAMFQTDLAAGAKRPLHQFKCVSCDKSVDPTPLSRPAGWPQMYVTESIRPHLDFMRYHMIQSGDSNDSQKLKELKIKNLTLARQFHRYMRQQECAEFKEAGSHFGNMKFPHCNHNLSRPAGGKTNVQNAVHPGLMLDKNPRKFIENRLDGFIQKNNLAIQFPHSARSSTSLTARSPIPGLPDIEIRSAKNHRSAESTPRWRSIATSFDASILQPGIQEVHARISNGENANLEKVILMANEPTKNSVGLALVHGDFEVTVEAAKFPSMDRTKVQPTPVFGLLAPNTGDSNMDAPTDDFLPPSKISALGEPVPAHGVESPHERIPNLPAANPQRPPSLEPAHP